VEGGGGEIRRHFQLNPGKAMGSSKVLLLENVAAQAAAARNSLSGTGYQLLMSRFEANGIKRAGEWKPDVIVLANTYTNGSLTDFCRRLKEAARRPVPIVIASSLPLERLSEEEPDLKSVADGFVLRPYSPVKLKEVLDHLTGRSGPVEGDGEEEGRGSLEGKGVLVLDRDPEMLRILREHLAPRGVKVDAPHWEKAADYCRAHSPHAVVLEWPTPAGFTIEMLREIRETGQGKALPVVLLSRAGQDVVRNQAPAMLNQTGMLFTKPVSWGPFFRYLAGLLKHAPAASRENTAPPPVGGEQGLQDRFQKEMEAKFLEVEELKQRLKSVETQDAVGGESTEREKLRKENSLLRSRMEEDRKQMEVDLGKMQLREAELEVKLSSIIRKKGDSERRAQDLIDAAAARAEGKERELEEVRGELQVTIEDTVALRSDLEKTLVQKEQAEEKLQAVRGSLEKDREELGKKLAGSLADLEKANGELADLRGREAERLRSAGEEKEEQERLRGDLAELGERSDLRELKLTALQEEIDSLQEARQREKSAPDPAVSERLGELEERLKEKEESLAALSKTAEERDEAIAGLREKLHDSGKAVAGLDEELAGWRHRWAESEAQLADLASREAKLARECEQLQAGGKGERITELEGLLEEKEEKLRGMERKHVVTGAFASELESKVQEYEGAREELEESLREQRELAGRLEKDLRERDETVRLLQGSLAESEEKTRRGEEALREGGAVTRGLREKLEAKEAECTDMSARRRESGEKLHEIESALKERGGEVDSLRERSRELEEELSGLKEQVRELQGRLQEVQEEGAEEKRSREAMVEQHLRTIGDEEKKRRDLEEQLRLVGEKAEAAEAGSREYEKMQQLLQEVTARAQSEVIERTRGEMELQERLKASVENKKFLLARLEREVTEAAEREKRLTALLDSALQNSSEYLSSHPGKGQGNLPVIISPPASKQARVSPAVATVLALLLLAVGGWFAFRSRGVEEPTAGRVPAGESPARGLSSPEGGKAGDDPVASQREVWEDWTRSDVSGGVLLQATLRGRDEMAAEVQAEQRAQGWSDLQAAEELERLLKPYRFGENFYFYLYLKNLQPGYPSYVDDLYTHLTLRDDRGNEAAAFLPSDMEKNRRVYSFTAGELSKSRDDLIYEVTVPVAFPRGTLAPRPAYIQLLAYNIGGSSRRVLTWELE
jgi:CheY-like chemotaxis protein